jgi:hypothetical protein
MEHKTTKVYLPSADSEPPNIPKNSSGPKWAQSIRIVFWNGQYMRATVKETTDPFIEDDWLQEQCRVAHRIPSSVCIVFSTDCLCVIQKG